jgi:hypothetical protein
MLATWLYISVCNVASDAHATTISDILAVSRPRNLELSVTGALIFSGSAFAQAIEGPADSIATLRAAIERDPRHRDVRTFEHGACEARRFEKWALAYSGSSTFVDLELQRIAALHATDPTTALRSLKLLLKEFARG